MSPRNVAKRISARDGMIRKLAPSVMRAFDVDRQVAILALSSLSENDRLVMQKLRGYCLTIKRDNF